MSGLSFEHVTDFLAGFSSLTIAGSVFVAGFLGSPHCASMCGPLIFALAPDRMRLFLYHFGRGLTYAGAGALAGGLGPTWVGSGTTVTAGSAVREIPHLLSLFSLSMMIIFLTVSAIRLLRGHSLHVHLPAIITRQTEGIWRRVLTLSKRRPLAGAAIAGGLTIFLPCGHLYAFIAGAMATGRWWSGLAFMVIFWLSTLPVLAFAAAGVQRLVQPRLAKSPRLAGGMLLLAGLIGITQFARSLDRVSFSDLTAPASHRAHGVGPQDTAQPLAPVTSHHCH